MKIELPSIEKTNIIIIAAALLIIVVGISLGSYWAYNTWAEKYYSPVNRMDRAQRYITQHKPKKAFNELIELYKLNPTDYKVLTMALPVGYELGVDEQDMLQMLESYNKLSNILIFVDIDVMDDYNFRSQLKDLAMKCNKEHNQIVYYTDPLTYMPLDGTGAATNNFGDFVDSEGVQIFTSKGNNYPLQEKVKEDYKELASQCYLTPGRAGGLDLEIEEKLGTLTHNGDAEAAIVLAERNLKYLQSGVLAETLSEDDKKYYDTVYDRIHSIAKGVEKYSKNEDFVKSATFILHYLYSAGIVTLNPYKLSNKKQGDTMDHYYLAVNRKYSMNEYYEFVDSYIPYRVEFDL